MNVTRQQYDKRKRLGQFFTGQSLARLLASLADANTASSIIDPMCGTGDMLRAAAELSPRSHLTGIEIDKDVIAEAETYLGTNGRTVLIQGNAFDSRTLNAMPSKQFDLVITNPPYVRYQSFAHRSGHSEEIPNAAEVREQVFEAARLLLSDSEDRQLLQSLVRSYSGLSDLAVPSWLLAAMLTRVGGKLALVVPESWLSRDYAQVIQYLILRWFRIRYIIEDTNASWFPGVLVKTTLLIAERIQRRESALAWGDDKYAHVRISAAAGNRASVVGNLFEGSSRPEKLFVTELESKVQGNIAYNDAQWSLEFIPLAHIAGNLNQSALKESWFLKSEKRSGAQLSPVSLPIELARWLDGGKYSLISTEQAGIAVGQGLRTGANTFFYVDFLRAGESDLIVRPHKAFGIDTLRINPKSVRHVIRRQFELPNGYLILKKNLPGRVLLIQEKVITGDLREFIKVAERTHARGRLIPELSAVKTNVRAKKGNNEKSFWYMLPSLASRHTPDLLIARVNGGHPRAYLNEPEVVVDANFSTVWLNEDSVFTKWSLLSILNSTWSIAAMELLGSVMGGGALKLEATHLKRLPMPKLSSVLISQFDELGHTLAEKNDDSILRRIDELIVGAFFPDERVDEKLVELKGLGQRRYDERVKRL